MGTAGGLARAGDVFDTAGVDELRTGRLLLRHWRAEDEPAMAQITSDPDVGRYLNRPVDEQAVAEFFGQIVGHWETHGYGPWALEARARARGTLSRVRRSGSPAAVSFGRGLGPGGGLASGALGMGARTRDRGRDRGAR